MSVLISFCFIYILYILLPLIPSVLIYKIFPDTKLTLSGPFQGLKLNATGAFAGYIVCCLIGYNIISRAMNAIDAKQTWIFNADVKLVKQDSVTRLKDQETEFYLKQLNPIINPPMIRHNDNSVTMYIPQDLLENNANISMCIDGFVTEVIKKSDIDKAHKDGRTINYGTITLRQYNNGTPYDRSKTFDTTKHG